MERDAKYAGAFSHPSSSRSARQEDPDENTEVQGLLALSCPCDIYLICHTWPKRRRAETLHRQTGGRVPWPPSRVHFGGVAGSAEKVCEPNYVDQEGCRGRNDDLHLLGKPSSEWSYVNHFLLLGWQTEPCRCVL